MGNSLDLETDRQSDCTLCPLDFLARKVKGTGPKIFRNNALVLGLDEDDDGRERLEDDGDEHQILDATGLAKTGGDLTKTWET